MLLDLAIQFITKQRFKNMQAISYNIQEILYFEQKEDKIRLLKFIVLFKSISILEMKSNINVIQK